VSEITPIRMRSTPPRSLARKPSDTSQTLPWEGARVLRTATIRSYQRGRRGVYTCASSLEPGLRYGAGGMTEVSMNIEPQGPANGQRQRPTAVIVAAGVALGLAVGVLLYLWLNPILEGRDDPLEEFQGLLFNIVPAGAVAGGLLAWWLSRRLCVRP
jgi:hypothetical protein